MRPCLGIHFVALVLILWDSVIVSTQYVATEFQFVKGITRFTPFVAVTIP